MNENSRILITTIKLYTHTHASMLKLTTRNNNTNAATTREIYPRIIRGISIDSPRTAIGHERVRLSRTKHEPPRQPKWMIYRARRENDTKWRGQSVLPSFSPIVSRKKKRKNHRRIIRKLWSARFGRLKNPLFGPRKTFTRYKPARLFSPIRRR